MKVHVEITFKENETQKLCMNLKGGKTEILDSIAINTIMQGRPEYKEIKEIEVNGMVNEKTRQCIIGRITILEYLLKN